VKKLIPGGVVSISSCAGQGLLADRGRGERPRGGVYLEFHEEITWRQIAPLESVLPRRRTLEAPAQGRRCHGAKNRRRRWPSSPIPTAPIARKLHEELKQDHRHAAGHCVLYVPVPLPCTRDAYKKSQAVLCEKSPQLLDEALSGKAMPEPKCGNEQLEKILALGKEMGVSGTPALIREDGTHPQRPFFPLISLPTGSTASKPQPENTVARGAAGSAAVAGRGMRSPTGRRSMRCGSWGGPGAGQAAVGVLNNDEIAELDDETFSRSRPFGRCTGLRM